MDKKIIGILIAVASGMILLGVVVVFAWPRFYTHTKQLETIPSPSSRASLVDHQQVLLVFENNMLTAEVVNTPASITQGLSGREQIGADGMLFVLGSLQTPLFWMKEMKFGLDLVWIREMTIVDISHNVPAPEPGTPLTELPRYQPNQPVDMVFEIPAGHAESLDLTIGSSFTIQ